MDETTEIAYTSISPAYVPHWTRVNALRELVQNALDSHEEFKCDYSICYEDGAAVIRDYGPGLQKKHFVMGLSEKSENSIGQFGEGLKLAMLFYARSGSRFELRTGNIIVKPVVASHPSFNTDVLALMIQNHQAPIQGVEIKAQCEEEELDEAKKQFLAMHHQMRVLDTYMGEYVKGQIMMPGGYFFVHNQLIFKRPSLFSYNLLDKSIINRDRSSADECLLRINVKELIAHTTSEEVAREVVKAVFLNQQDIYELQLQWYEDNRVWSESIWLSAIKSVLGEKICLSISTLADPVAEYIGYRVVKPRDGWRNLFASLIPSSVNIASMRGAFHNQVAPYTLPQDKLSKFMLAMKATNKLIKKFKESPICHMFDDIDGLNTSNTKIYKELYKGTEKAQALYDPKTKEILLSISVLDLELPEVCGVIAHELTHKITRASPDCSYDFINGMEKLLGFTLSMTVRR